MSSDLSVVLGVAGAGTIGLGIWHLGVPRWFAYDRVLATASADLGRYEVGPFRYARRPEDLVGIAWVMSNAASFVLLSVGVLDLAWAAGDRTIPITLGGLWIAAFWALRAGSQLAIGHRRIDVAMLLVFAAASLVHVMIAVGA